MVKADQRDYAETVRRSGEVLLDVVNDILDFSTIDSGKLELESSAFDLRVLVEDVAELFVAQARLKGLELTTRIERAVPPAVFGDPGRVRQIVTNLVGNAIKFTDAGEWPSKCRCWRRGSDPSFESRSRTPGRASQGRRWTVSSSPSPRTHPRPAVSAGAGWTACL